MIAWTLRTLWTHLGRPLEAAPRYRTGRVTAGPTVGAPAGAGKDEPDEQSMTTGIITTLRDRGGGAIVPAAGPRRQLAFDRSAVAPGGFARLRLGQVVAFDEEDEEADPSDRARPRATRVTPLAAAGDPVTPGTP